MRKVILSVLAAASALAAASPAAAQYYPAPQPGYGYNNGYNGYNGYGYNSYGQVRSMQVRIDRIQQRIQRFDSRDRISEREARNLRAESRDIERRLHYAARNGLNSREASAINYRIQRLEQRFWRDANDGNRWGNDNRWGYNGQNGWSDRDRDGRDDRYEDDRGYRHD